MQILTESLISIIKNHVSAKNKITVCPRISIKRNSITLVSSADLCYNGFSKSLPPRGRWQLKADGGVVKVRFHTRQFLTACGGAPFAQGSLGLSKPSAYRTDKNRGVVFN